VLLAIFIAAVNNSNSYW